MKSCTQSTASTVGLDGSSALSSTIKPTSSRFETFSFSFLKDPMDMSYHPRTKSRGRRLLNILGSKRIVLTDATLDDDLASPVSAAGITSSNHDMNGGETTDDDCASTIAQSGSYEVVLADIEAFFDA